MNLYFKDSEDELGVETMEMIMKKMKHWAQLSFLKYIIRYTIITKSKCHQVLGLMRLIMPSYNVKSQIFRECNVDSST